ncbi:hypothetical protein OG730_41605 (plasmid) [Streptomyces sp. NBC_01298]|uniref:hypothetical protein n=1 Tax=Streptomyces sp. NBC_01298 TaxID=2903817 RepID=UPI002E0F37E2|nr:hypothetical protein OG730_41605 [Streptomyces sp. NBC_01298]
MKSSQITAFHTALARLAAAGFRCTVESDGKTTDESWAAYHFADTSHLTWGAISDTGAENSATHPVSAHRALSAFFITDYGDEPQLFDSGDFDRDVAALLAWITDLADTHGASQQ